MDQFKNSTNEAAGKCYGVWAYMNGVAMVIKLKFHAFVCFIHIHVYTENMLDFTYIYIYE